MKNKMKQGIFIFCIERSKLFLILQIIHILTGDIQNTCSIALSKD
jgi:hypothetical protein